MSVLTKTEISEKITSLIIDNILRKIKPEHVREILNDINDSAFSSADEITHNNLSGLNDGDYKHLTASQLSALAILLSNTSGTNSGDQDLSSYATIALVDEVEAYLNGLIDDKENISNKVTNFTVIDNPNLYANIPAVVSYVAQQIANLVASSPSTLDTLNEIATALGNDPNFATTITTLIGTKQTHSNYLDQISSIGSALQLPRVNSAGNGIEWVTLSSSIPQSNKIYVDSSPSIGANSTGRGRIDNPYLTIEYALSDITNVGTVTATTTNSSNILTSVSSTSSIVIGQIISGSGIQTGSTVVSKTSNTITLSKNCTASASITANWLTIYEINTSGNFVWVSNWEKDGFIFNFDQSNVYFSGNCFNITTGRKCNFQVLNGIWSGTNTASKLMVSSASSNVDFIFKPISYYSIGTGRQLDCAQNGVTKFKNFYVDCQNFDCRFGYIADVEVSDIAYFSGYFYGLLGGILQRYCTLITENGMIETPSSINAIVTTTSGNVLSNSRIKGSININISAVFNGDIVGTTITLAQSSSYIAGIVVNGNINATTVNNSGFAILNGITSGSITNSGYKLDINQLAGTYTGSSTSKGKINDAIKNDVNNGLTSITLSGSAELILLDSKYQSTYTYTTLSIASGCKLDNYGYLRCYISSLAGTLNNYGRLIHQYCSASITGTLENKGGYIELTRDGQSEDATYTPCIVISTGTYKQDGGILFCSVATSKSGLIRKNANGGKVLLKGQPQLIVSNGLAPLQILSNAGTAPDVHNFGIIGNGASGFRIANTFSDTTYGTAYAPNLIGTATNNEDTTYTF